MYAEPVQVERSEPTRTLPVRACAACGRDYRPLFRGQATCGWHRCVRRVNYLRKREDPAWVERNRANNRAWAATHRSVTRANPWLRGGPAVPALLPGGMCEIDLSPAPRWPVELRNTRHLHGLITTIIGDPHDPHLPAWALVPRRDAQSRSHWAAWFLRDDLAQRMSGAHGRAEFFGVQTDVRLGEVVSAASPTVRRGHQRVRVDAVTPVVLRSEQTMHTAPTEAMLLGALVGGSCSVPNRIGWADRVDTSDARLVLRERDTQPEGVETGGKYGTVRGWVGSVDLEVNAVARWLLEVAALVGLGGRTAFGFGRIRVTSC